VDGIGRLGTLQAGDAPLVRGWSEEGASKQTHIDVPTECRSVMRGDAIQHVLVYHY
jgi:hypothetical protein